MKQTSHSVNSNMQQKITINSCTVPSQIDFIQYKFEHYFICENHSKDTLNHHELYETVIQM